MADRDRRASIFAHQEWLGFVQPVGLVVAPTVMVDAQVVPDRNIGGRQRELRELLEETRNGSMTGWRAPDLRRLFLDWLGWEDIDLADAARHRDVLEIALPELQAVLSPTWAVPSEEDTDGNWTMLVRIEDDGASLDEPPADGGGWNATRHARFERLLRETGIPIGLLCTDERMRLIYAPKGESSGHVTFEFSQMALPAGRPILAAFDMLLSAGALFGAAPEARLPALLAKSREAQAEVSTRLSRQVLAALYELLRGFIAADARVAGSLTALARDRPEHLYGGMITALMRLVFVLYAEDRGLMPDRPVYQQHYSLGGLFARLRADAAAWPDTMDQRFGAWAQLLSLFRLIHGGGGHAGLSFVARRGALFDPARYPFLEGREYSGMTDLPMVPDATVWKVLQSLMVLDGERLSYRTLDVEQIGSVYEAVMGFRVELTAGRSIAVRSTKRTGAAVVVDLDNLLTMEGGRRTRALQDAADRKLTGAAAAALRDAKDPADVVAALDRAVDRDATPDIVPAGTPVLQPTDERRRSGSHYTPRSLTEPIVSEVLRPVLEGLGSTPRPEALLDLKVLDPAMGSGAFLVEACRQLAAELVDAWSSHDGPPDIPPDEDELLHARRLIAQRCLYGVDRNPMAVDLARLSLWLATLARDHEFTFVDHALRHGDFLVGLTRDRIAAVDWAGGESQQMALLLARDCTERAEAERARIRDAAEGLGEEALRPLLDRADRHLDDVRLVGDAVVAAFFRAEKSKARKAERAKVLEVLDFGEVGWQDTLAPLAAGLRKGEKPVYPFHFEIEFPEVFDRDNPGFDAVIGNPPFGGKNTVAAANAAGYPDWLKAMHAESHGNSDIVAHFFRRAFGLLRNRGALGLIATNTIGQGDTRSTGLRWICKHGGTIYRARRRIKWPGEAAVVVSVLHILKGILAGPKRLDGREVDAITAFLFHRGGHDDPVRLKANEHKSFVGSYVLGMGFTFDDTDGKGVATPLAEMERLIASEPRNREAIFPYIGGEEVNTSPTHVHHRYVINFRDWPLRRADLGATWRDADDEQRRDWRRDGIVPLDYPDPVAADRPELLAIVEERVKPARAHLTTNAIGRKRAKFFWQYGSPATELYAAIASLDRVLVISRVGQQAAYAFLPRDVVYAESMIVFPFETLSAFCALQSRPHETWARFFGSSLEDRLRYTPSDCFETFPFPEDWETHPALEAAGEAYYEFRAMMMVENAEGLTKTYNRFHDPAERDPRIAELRALHSAMDRAVLDAYGWRDIPTDYEFLLDYDIDEESWGRKKKPWRYRWPDDVRDDVLARLLALNAERAIKEQKDCSLSGGDAISMRVRRQ